MDDQERALLAGADNLASYFIPWALRGGCQCAGCFGQCGQCKVLVVARELGLIPNG